MLLQSQIFSITNVPEVYQRIIGVNGRSRVCTGLGAREAVQPARIVLLDARHAYGAPLEELVVPFKPTGSTAAGASPPSPPQAAARAFQAPRERCTRALLGHVPALQPMFTSPGRPNKRYCAYCAKSGAPARELFAGCVPAATRDEGGYTVEAWGGFICEGYSEETQYDAKKGAPPVDPAGVLAGDSRAHCLALLRWEAARHQAVLEQEHFQHILAADPSLQQKVQKVAGRLASAVKHVRQYEAPSAQVEAIAEMPLVRLWHDAAAKAAALWKQHSGGEVSQLDPAYAQPAQAGGAFPSNQASQCSVFRDTALKLVTAWFKNEFFKWTNNPPCASCGNGSTTGVGAVAPTAAEREGQAGHVEVYSCSACSAVTRFPRYNNPLTLLKSRQGRCGEWANAFAFICTALGWDTRHVHDWTDHVWVEVWSPAQCKWLHVDPCENAVDAPLLYEAGWGKKLNWVIAMSPREVVDVTWRYTQQWEEVAQRRAEVPENWLAAYIAALDWQQFQHGQLHLPLSDEAPQASAAAIQLVLASAADIAQGKVGSGADTSSWLAKRMAYISQRRQLENIQMSTNMLLKAGGASAAEASGRLSGSLQWRLARAETGNTAAGAGGVAASSQYSDASESFSAAGRISVRSAVLLAPGLAPSASVEPPSNGAGAAAMGPAEVSTAFTQWDLRISSLASWGSITAAVATLLTTGQPTTPEICTVVWRPTKEITQPGGTVAAGHTCSRTIGGPTVGAALKAAGWRPQAVLVHTVQPASAPHGSLRGNSSTQSAYQYFPASSTYIASLVAVPGTQYLLAVAVDGRVHALQPCTAEAKAAAIDAGVVSPITDAPVKSFFVCSLVAPLDAGSTLGSVRHAALVDDSLVALCSSRGKKEGLHLCALSITAAECFGPTSNSAVGAEWLYLSAAPANAVAVVDPPPVGKTAWERGVNRAAVLTSSGALLVPNSAVCALAARSTSADLRLALGFDGQSAAKVSVTQPTAGLLGAIEVTVSLPVHPPALGGKAPAGRPRQHAPAALAAGPLHLVVKPLSEPLEAALLRGAGRIVKAPGARHAGCGWIRLSEMALGTLAQEAFSHGDAQGLAAAAADIPGLQPALVPLLGKLLPRNTALSSMWCTGQDRTACLDTAAQQVEFKQRLAAQLKRMVTSGGNASLDQVLWRGTVPAARMPACGSSGAVLECLLVHWNPSPPSLRSVGGVEVLARSQPWRQISGSEEHVESDAAVHTPPADWAALVASTVLVDEGGDSEPSEGGAGVACCSWEGGSLLVYSVDGTQAQVITGCGQ